MRKIICVQNTFYDLKNETIFYFIPEKTLFYSYEKNPLKKQLKFKTIYTIF